MSKDEGLTQTQKDVVDVFFKGGDLFKELYQITLEVLREAIKVGKNYPPMGMMALVMYLDLLHGGCKTTPIWTQPYYVPELREKMLEKIELPAGAKDEQQEVLLNSEVPTRFPKIISDQVYFWLKEWAMLFFTDEFFKTAATGLSTLVEGPSKGIASLIKARAVQPE